MKNYLSVVAVAAIAGSIAAGALQTMISAFAVQNEIIPPTAGIYTGVQYSQLIGDAMRSVVSGNKGNSAPANVAGATLDGQRWIDDTTSTWLKKTYVNGGWATEGAYGSSDSSWIGVIGGGAPVSIASASTVDLGSVPQSNVTITGTTTVTGFGSGASSGIIKLIRFDNALTLTHSGALSIPCGFNLVTANGDRAIVTHLGSGNWEVTQYTRASGIPIDCAAVGKAEFGFFATVPELHLQGDGRAITRTSYPAYVAKMTRVQNGTRTSGNATITGIADTSAFGQGMPVESTGVNAGCTIASVVANTSITLNSSSCVTASGTSPVTVFLTGYGTGGSASTIGVPDCRGRSFAGRDHATPGTLANRLTTNWFGKNAAIMGVTGGDEKQTLDATQIPTITAANASQSITVGSASVHIPFANSSWAQSNNFTTTGSTTASFTAGSVGDITTISGTNSIAVTSNNTGGLAHPIVPPTMIAECTVRVTP